MASQAAFFIPPGAAQARVLMSKRLDRAVARGQISSWRDMAGLRASSSSNKERSGWCSFLLCKLLRNHLLGGGREVGHSEHGLPVH